MTTIFITGAGGFVGHHIVDYFLHETDWHVCIERRFEPSRRLIDIGALTNPRLHYDVTKAEYLLHLGAKTRIADSIKNPRSFAESNIYGTLEMLEFARQLPNLKKFLYFSTDEVFGPRPSEGPPFGDWARYNPGNPYAATKAAAEELCMAWGTTYGLPVIITHAQNLIGERQSPEKFLPSVVRAAFKREKIKIYFDAETTAYGFRDYLHAQDAASAVHFLLKAGVLQEKYNIARPVGDQISNLTILTRVAFLLDKDIDFEPIASKLVRPGFSLRYGLDGDKLFKMGWKPRKFNESLEETVAWLARPENSHWLENS